MSKDFSIAIPSPLFQVEGNINEANIRILERKYGLSPTRQADGKIATPFRGQSSFFIGDFVPISLNDFVEKSQRLSLAEIKSEIKRQAKTYEFFPVRLACSFDPADGCRFHSARFDISLQTTPISPGSATQPSQEQAIAYDLAPLKCEDNRETTKTKTGWGIKVGGDSFPFGVTTPSRQQSTTYGSNTSYVEAINLQGSQPGWKFARTLTHEISGVQELFMLIRKSKGTQVKATFSLTVQVQFLIGGKALDELLPLVTIFRRPGSSATVMDPTAFLC